VKIGYSKIQINGEWFIWDERESEREREREREGERERGGEREREKKLKNVF
jgi:hypothetical protein